MNMKVCAWMVVKDDVFYVDLAIKSVLPYVDGVYIQDQLSTDGTTERIKQLQEEYPGKIIHELEDTDVKERFESTYNEPLWRTTALRRAEEIFDPQFLLKLDADEFYTPHFFEQLKNLEAPLQCKTFNSLMISGERFISTKYRAACPDDERRDRFENKYYDPHILFWSRRVKVNYIRNPAFPNSYLHCIMSPEPTPTHWVPGLCVLHLHRTFGPKAKIFWEEGGEKLDKKPYNPKEQCPNWYNHRVNMGTAERLDFNWPDYVLERWSQWGEIWE